jgi:mannose-6-phosphate isomerase-like protein (cupin superfamily)
MQGLKPALYSNVMIKIDLQEKLSSFEETWSPKIVAELNDQYVKVAKCEGEYVWHHHDDEDEAFWVLEGRLDIQFRDRVVELGPGELCVVPRGVEHKPVARPTASIALFEPASTRNTGNVDHEYTIEASDLERI